MSNSSPKGRMASQDNIERILKCLADIGPLRIVWSGGEPLLYTGLSKNLELSKSLGNINILATNGTIKSEQKVLKYVDRYQISCPSIDRHIYLRMRGDNNIELVLKNTERIIRSGAKVTLFLVVCELNLLSIEKTIQKWVGIGCKRIIVSNLKYSGRAVNWGMKSLNYEEIAEIQDGLSSFIEGNRVFVTWPNIEKDRMRDAYLVIDETGKVISGASKENCFISDMLYKKKLEYGENLSKTSELFGKLKGCMHKVKP
ncbi:MAG: radical SAM protein [Mesoflavibacter sp.]|nr:radical SAM protein [Mesoflavibacter sp.]